MNKIMNKSCNGKKAQGLSLDMIVVGAIALVVLVVIVTMFTTYSRRTGTELANVSGGADCSVHGGKMAKIGDCEAVGGTPIVGNFYGDLYTDDDAKTGADLDKKSGGRVKADGLTYVCCREP